MRTKSFRPLRKSFSAAPPSAFPAHDENSLAAFSIASFSLAASIVPWCSARLRMIIDASTGHSQHRPNEPRDSYRENDDAERIHKKGSVYSDHLHCFPVRLSVGGCLFPVQAQLGARTLIVVGTQHLTSRGIDHVMAVAGQAQQGLVDIVPVVGVDFFSNPTLDVPAGCRAAIEKSRHCIRLVRFRVSYFDLAQILPTRACCRASSPGRVGA